MTGAEDAKWRLERSFWHERDGRILRWTRGVLLLLICFPAAWGLSKGLHAQRRATPGLLDDGGRQLDLAAHWARKDVFVLLRHTERCDHSDSPCLDGEDGITVPGREMALALGKGFAGLPLGDALIFHSPVKRTRQTAEIAFGSRSKPLSWLHHDCANVILGEIFAHKPADHNVILVLHSTCVNGLLDEKGEPLIMVDFSDPASYGVAIFLTVDIGRREVRVLGQLRADEWARLQDQWHSPAGTPLLALAGKARRQ